MCRSEPVHARTYPTAKPGHALARPGHGLVATRDPLERPIILRTEMVAGHAGPSGREGRWTARCEEFAFALGQVGVTL